jgi:hypothetical protein
LLSKKKKIDSSHEKLEKLEKELKTRVWMRGMRRKAEWKCVHFE